MNEPPADIKAEIESEFGAGSDTALGEAVDPHCYLLWDSAKLLSYDAADLCGLTREQRIEFHRYRVDALLPAIEILDKEPQLPAAGINHRLEIVWMLEAIIEDEIERRTNAQIPDQPPGSTPRRLCCDCHRQPAASNTSVCGDCWIGNIVSHAVGNPTRRGRLRRLAYGA